MISDAMTMNARKSEKKMQQFGHMPRHFIGQLTAQVDAATMKSSNPPIAKNGTQRILRSVSKRLRVSGGEPRAGETKQRE